eukprot:2979846-Amphidinium_carterae.1
MLAEAELPMMRAYKRQEELCGSIRGSCSWHAEQAVGNDEHLSEMMHVFQNWQNQQQLLRFGFSPPGWKLADDELQEELALCDVLYDVVSCFLLPEVLTAMKYRRCPALCLAGLVHATHEKRDKCM